MSSDMYNNSSETNPTINCGLQFDSRHPALFSGSRTMETSWMGHHPIQTNIKPEPTEDAYEFAKRDQASAFNPPLTPPEINMAYTNFPTPQPDYPSGSSPSQGYPQHLLPPPTESTATPRSDGKSSPRLTPPGSIPSPIAMDIDKQEIHEGSQSSNSENEFYENTDPLRRLQMVLQRTGMMPEEKLQCPLCDFTCHVRPQFNEHLVSHENKCAYCDYEAETSEKLKEHLKIIHDCDDEIWLEEEPGLKIPKVNSQGKVKTFRCKQCEFCAVTKLEFWEHSRSHIKHGRLLTCPKCPFVTEYKHHLEYHLRNHFGSKPFKCDKCSYCCVNKSMLNSHLKSHSNIYQFRCSNCTYATKYCHSLKLHLRKYNHSPAMVLNPDGSPNPNPIVDVYGTKRGPKQKHNKSTPEKSVEQMQPDLASVSPQIPANFFNPYNHFPSQMPYYSMLSGLSSFSLPQSAGFEEKNNNVEKMSDVEDGPKEEPSAPLDLSCSYKMENGRPIHTDTPITKHRRKGIAFKLERLSVPLPESDEEPEMIVTKPDLPYPDESKSPEIQSCEAESETQNPVKEATKSDGFKCSYCGITFEDIVMYTMHMGYHGYQDPFTCNMCGQQTSDKVAFFLHIARTPHS